MTQMQILKGEYRIKGLGSAGPSDNPVPGPSILDAVSP